jgi:hypothetical protein
LILSTFENYTTPKFSGADALGRGGENGIGIRLDLGWR